MAASRSSVLRSRGPIFYFSTFGRTSKHLMATCVCTTRITQAHPCATACFTCNRLEMIDPKSPGCVYYCKLCRSLRYHTPVIGKVLNTLQRTATTFCHEHSGTLTRPHPPGFPTRLKMFQSLNISLVCAGQKTPASICQA